MFTLLLKPVKFHCKGITFVTVTHKRKGSHCHTNVVLFISLHGTTIYWHNDCQPAQRIIIQCRYQTQSSVLKKISNKLVCNVVKYALMVRCTQFSMYSEKICRPTDLTVVDMFWLIGQVRDIHSVLPPAPLETDGWSSESIEIKPDCHPNWSLFCFVLFVSFLQL